MGNDCCVPSAPKDEPNADTTLKSSAIVAKDNVSSDKDEHLQTELTKPGALQIPMSVHKEDKEDSHRSNEPVHKEITSEH